MKVVVVDGGGKNSFSSRILNRGDGGLKKEKFGDQICYYLHLTGFVHHEEFFGEMRHESRLIVLGDEIESKVGNI